MSRSGYNQILKSSIMTGGAQVLTLIAGFIRMKIAALCMGPSGVGMIGLFNQSTVFVIALAGLGLNSSGVREVAAAEGTGDPEKLARVVRSLRLFVLGTGLLAALFCYFFSTYLSKWTFGDESQSSSFALLGIALFLSEISNGQAALLRGLGKIRELAFISVLVSFGSTVLAGTCYWIWAAKGIAFALVAMAAMGLLGSWWYARQIKLVPVSLSLREVLKEGSGMLKMGLSFVWSSFVMMGVSFLIGILVREHLGLQGNGFYQAAWGMSGLFVGFVLGAMGQDFYPRLTGLIDRREEACRLINQQIEIGVLLALTGIVGTIAFSHWLIPLLYSKDFLPASDAVVWFTLGCFGRIVSWPLGYVLIAKGESMWYAVTETLFALMQLLFSWLGLKYWGLTGISCAFALLYVFHGTLMRILVGRLIGFRYRSESLHLIAIGLIVSIFAMFSGPWFGIPLVAACAIFCIRGVSCRLDEESALLKKIRAIPLIGVFVAGRRSS